jgi:N-acetylglucosaminyldiphosphoundecaprenol N-acetyl-beta-D-mannosaminyltransferase
MKASKQARRIFGFLPSRLSAAEIARQAAARRRTIEDGVCLVITPNIDHVARLRHDGDFAAAYAQADIVTCDGWPVALYARLRGLPALRVTGYDIAAELLRNSPLAAWQRLFFVADSEPTADGLRHWAARRGVADHIGICVPPHGFLDNPAFCRSLLAQINAHRTTLLLMGVGAPRSEIFVARHRSMMVPCWAFCVGQALMVEAGTIRRAPPALQHVGLEWGWRLVHEPRRLVRRYIGASRGFLLAIYEDLHRRRPSSTIKAPQ